MSYKPVKVLIVGAGSFFTNDWIKDIALIPSIERGVFALVDTDETRLKLTVETAKKVLAKLGKEDHWEIQYSTERRTLMPDTDYLVNTVEVAGVETVKSDYEIPKQFGIDQCIGDTTGPGGIMKALRTLPAWLEILKDAQELCPEAIVLNYTNPMGIVTLAGLVTTSMQILGLCHSVQGTALHLADYAGVPLEELEWECAGINHLAWFTRLKHKGKDLYPLLREKINDPELLSRDPVRFELMKQLGAFPTESSGHVSEYIPYIRKRQELIDQHCGEGYLGGSGFYSKNWPGWRTSLDKVRYKWLHDQPITKEELESSNMKEERLKLGERSIEYASYIIEAHHAGTPAVVHANVMNSGLIENLPQDGVVEVAGVVDRSGFHPCHFGDLPEQLAALDRPLMTVQRLCVQGILEKDREAIIHSMMVDPLTAAVCSLQEIRKMAEELFVAQRDYIPEFLFS